MCILYEHAAAVMSAIITTRGTITTTATESYRPSWFSNHWISILPAFSNVFEQAVYIQLYDYINKNTYITDIITKEIDRGKLFLGCF